MGLQLPARLGSEYELLERLGRGGMGEVFRGRQLSLDRPVAVKVMQELDPVAYRRFEREARLMSSIRHEGLVAVLDFGRQGNIPYLVMELVTGETLRQRMDRAPLEPAQVIEIVCALCEPLARIHESGIVHRDVKPDNIFLTADGRVKLGDFGIARTTASGSTVTQQDMVVGSPMYMAPERFGEAAADPRSDQYSLGVIAYEILGHRSPHEGAFPSRTQAPVSLGELAPDLPPAWIAAIDRALSPERLQRFAGVEELGRALEPPRPVDVAGPAIDAPRSRSGIRLAPSVRNITSPPASRAALGWLGMVLTGVMLVAVVFLHRPASRVVAPPVATASPAAAGMDVHLALIRQSLHRYWAFRNGGTYKEKKDRPKFDPMVLKPDLRHPLHEAMERIGLAVQAATGPGREATWWEWTDLYVLLEEIVVLLQSDLHHKAAEVLIPVPPEFMHERIKTLKTMKALDDILDPPSTSVTEVPNSPRFQSMRRFMRMEIHENMMPISWNIPEHRRRHDLPAPMESRLRVALGLEGLRILVLQLDHEDWQPPTMDRLLTMGHIVAREADEVVGLDMNPTPPPPPIDLAASREVHELDLQLLEKVVRKPLPATQFPGDRNAYWMLLVETLQLLHPPLSREELSPRVIEIAVSFMNRIDHPPDPIFLVAGLHDGEAAPPVLFPDLVARCRKSGKVLAHEEWLTKVSWPER